MGYQTAVAQTSPRIEISPKQVLVDQPVSIRVLGLKPGEKVTLSARYTNAMHLNWESHAEFVADAHGIVNPADQPSLSGTYTGVALSGLFWSMVVQHDEKPANGAEQQKPDPSDWLLPNTVTVTADVDGNPVASGDFKRLAVAPSVIRKPVREDGLVGTLFLPGKPGRYPGVIVLGGSEGGLSENRAALLASHGFAALALAYFGYENLPKYLVDIPLEYFGTAIHWMQSQPGVAGNRLAVLGASRGGELSLLVGSTFPQIKAVVAYVPSGEMWSGLTADFNAPPQTSWTYQGKPLPFVGSDSAPAPSEPPATAERPHGPISFTPVFLRLLENHASVEQAAIPVEKINGPVLLLSGDDDKLWPSTPMSNMVMERLASHHHPFHDQHLSYPGTGHLFGTPNLPSTMTHMVHPVGHVDIAFGGDAKDIAAASSDSWPHVLAFLKASLKKSAKR